MGGEGLQSSWKKLNHHQAMFASIDAGMAKASSEVALLRRCERQSGDCKSANWKSDTLQKGAASEGSTKSSKLYQDCNSSAIAASGGHGVAELRAWPRELDQSTIKEKQRAVEAYLRYHEGFFELPCIF